MLSLNGYLIIMASKIIFKSIPKDKKYRDKETSRPIGMTHYPMQFVDSKKPIIASLKNKAKKYGNLKKPYIIALNILDLTIDKDDIFESLFGSISYRFNTNTSCFTDTIREPNGFWFTKKGPTYTRVSGVIIALNIYPWTVGINKVKIYS